MLPSVKNQLRNEFRKLLRLKQLNAGDVTIHWRELDADSPPDDPELASILGDTALDTTTPGVTKTRQIRALIHYVTPATVANQRNTEVAVGDVILDIDASEDLSIMRDPRFTIGNVTYVQKDAGGDLASSWDVRVGGDAIVRTLLLRPQQ